MKRRKPTPCPRCLRLSCLGDSKCARTIAVEVIDGGSWRGVSESAWLARLTARVPRGGRDDQL